MKRPKRQLGRKEGETEEAPFSQSLLATTSCRGKAAPMALSHQGPRNCTQRKRVYGSRGVSNQVGGKYYIGSVGCRKQPQHLSFSQKRTILWCIVDWRAVCFFPTIVYVTVVLIICWHPRTPRGQENAATMIRI